MHSELKGLTSFLKEEENINFYFTEEETLQSSDKQLRTDLP